MLIVPKMSHAFTLEIPELCSRIFAEFIEQVEHNTWQGDQTVWIANEDANAPELAYQCLDNHLRYIRTPDAQSTVKHATWSYQASTPASQIDNPKDKQRDTEKPVISPNAQPKPHVKKTSQKRNELS